MAPRPPKKQRPADDETIVEKARGQTLLLDLLCRLTAAPKNPRGRECVLKALCMAPPVAKVVPSTSNHRRIGSVLLPQGAEENIISKEVIDVVIEAFNDDAKRMSVCLPLNFVLGDQGEQGKTIDRVFDLKSKYQNPWKFQTAFWQKDWWVVVPIPDGGAVRNIIVIQHICAANGEWQIRYRDAVRTNQTPRIVQAVWAALTFRYPPLNNMEPYESPGPTQEHEEDTTIFGRFLAFLFSEAEWRTDPWSLSSADVQALPNHLSAWIWNAVHAYDPANVSYLGCEGPGCCQPWLEVPRGLTSELAEELVSGANSVCGVLGGACDPPGISRYLETVQDTLPKERRGEGQLLQRSRATTERCDKRLGKTNEQCHTLDPKRKHLEAKAQADEAGGKKVTDESTNSHKAKAALDEQLRVSQKECRDLKKALAESENAYKDLKQAFAESENAYKELKKATKADDARKARLEAFAQKARLDTWALVQKLRIAMSYVRTAFHHHEWSTIDLIASQVIVQRYWGPAIETYKADLEDHNSVNRLVILEAGPDGKGGIDPGTMILEEGLNNIKRLEWMRGALLKRAASLDFLLQTGPWQEYGSVPIRPWSLVIEGWKNQLSFTARRCWGDDMNAYHQCHVAHAAAIKAGMRKGVPPHEVRFNGWDAATLATGRNLAWFARALGMLRFMIHRVANEFHWYMEILVPGYTGEDAKKLGDYWAWAQQCTQWHMNDSVIVSDPVWAPPDVTEWNHQLNLYFQSFQSFQEDDNNGATKKEAARNDDEDFVGPTGDGQGDEDDRAFAGPTADGQGDEDDRDFAGPTADGQDHEKDDATVPKKVQFSPDQCIHTLADTQLRCPVCEQGFGRDYAPQEWHAFTDTNSDTVHPRWWADHTECGLWFTERVKRSSRTKHLTMVDVETENVTYRGVWTIPKFISHRLYLACKSKMPDRKGQKKDPITLDALADHWQVHGFIRNVFEHARSHVERETKKSNKKKLHLKVSDALETKLKDEAEPRIGWEGDNASNYRYCWRFIVQTLNAMETEALANWAQETRRYTRAQFLNHLVSALVNPWDDPWLCPKTCKALKEEIALSTDPVVVPVVTDAVQPGDTSITSEQTPQTSNVP